MANQGVGNLGFGGGAVGGGLAPVSIAPVNTVGTSISISGTAANTPGNARSVTFVVNKGTIDIDGVTYDEGTYTFSNETFGTISPIAYDATASTNAILMTST